MILAVLVYNKYQSYQVQKQQKLEGLMVEQQRIVAEQRAAQGDLPMQGLSEQGRKNLENRGTELRSQSNPVNIKNFSKRLRHLYLNLNAMVGTLSSNGFF